MHDAALVGRAESVGDRCRDLQSPAAACAPCRACVEALALDQLHGEEVDALASSTEWMVTMFG